MFRQSMAKDLLGKLVMRGSYLASAPALAAPAVVAATAPSATAGFHSTASSSAPPQLGGYLRTGTTGMPTSAPKILVTGASGQVGSEFVPFLRERFGREQVIASDVRMNRQLIEDGSFVYCDVQDKDNLARIILENGVSAVVHLATLLSGRLQGTLSENGFLCYVKAVGERNPQLALRVNTAGIQNLLDLAATHNFQIYSPSTIAVFGPSTPRHATPDSTIKEPRTMYGITKVHQELLGTYYTEKLGVDYRSLRYPGIVSGKSMPGGGTTDYAVDIFHAALKHGRYECFLDENAALPMMYMPDCLEGTFQLMTAPQEALSQTTYNVTSMSFTPAELAASIRKYIPGFEMRYSPDFRNDIAKSWPCSIDDSPARADWGWSPKYDLDSMTAHMLNEISNQLVLEENRRKAGVPAASM